MSARGAALAALAAAVAPLPAVATVPALTGATVGCGGEQERVLLSPAMLAYWDEGASGRVYPEAVPGDVVLLQPGAADRLDGLAVTCTLAQHDALLAPAPAADEEEVDEELEDMSAADLVDLLAADPALADRVAAVEERRSPSQRRSSVAEAIATARQA